MLKESEEIALSLSGGGVRAIGFHLGTMDYLNRLGWLERVSILSSVSGGSLTAIGYAVSRKRGESFELFYQQLVRFASEVHTMEEIFANLSKKRPVVASLRRDMITGWAEVFRTLYFGKYYGDPSFGIFWEKPEIHLKEVMFNAVEMKSGVAFRFQHSQSTPRFRIGNGNVWLTHDDAKLLKISDVMASSACIPGGMEPLQFPEDYHWPDDEWTNDRAVSRPTCDRITKHLVENFGETARRLAIVDGGVYDNQTISSVLLALSRAHQKESGYDHELAESEPHALSAEYKPWLTAVMDHHAEVTDHDRLGLYIISDVPVRHDPMLAPDPDSCVPSRYGPGIRRMKVKHIRLAGFLVSAALLISAAVNLTNFLGSMKNLENIIEGVLTTLIPGLVALLILILLHRLRTWVRGELQKLIRADSYWHLIRNLTLGNVWDMIQARAFSLSKMVGFFMSRIRRLEYEAAYSNSHLKDKILANEIYVLLDNSPKLVPGSAIEFSQNLHIVVEHGANFPTKIWIDRFGDDAAPILRGRTEMEVLIATGHATIIYNLLDSPRNTDAELRTRLIKDWQQINDDPFHFVDHR